MRKYGLNCGRIKTFTMIEILVVIAIISILASLLLPSLARSRKQAQKTKCLSNLKQLGIATRAYINDSNYYPDAYQNAGGGKVYYWCTYYDGTNVDFANGVLAAADIQGYKVFQCPTFLDYTYKDASYGPACGYGINAEYVGGSPGQNEGVPTLNTNPAKDVEIKAPSDTLLYMDAAIDSGGLAEVDFLFWAQFNNKTGAQQDACVNYRHLGLACAVFCDGHGEDNQRPDATDNDSLQLGWPRLTQCDRD